MTDGPSLISIQAGKVQTHVDHETGGALDREWSTGIFKRAVEGPVVVYRTFLEGDEQADRINHGGEDKAICVYPADHYEFWRRTFGLAALPYGAFGENFTVAGASETDVCIGDTWAIGTALFQISQPRQPCWKLSRRWGIEDLARQVLLSGRSGWYYRVLRGGTVEAKMSCSLVERPHPEWTIADANNVMHDRAGDGRREMVLANLTLLSDSWRRTLMGRRG